MEKVKLTIDGREIETERGKTVLEAALENGIEIPVFCYHPCLKSVGACRICLVEIEKWPKLQVSCATAANEGMVVHTHSDKVVKARRGVLEFILANHPLDCPTCDKGGECPLQDTTFKYGLDFSRFSEKKRRFIRDENSTFDDLRIGPEIIRNQNRCIHCYRCTRLVSERFFENDLGSYQRGAHTEILPPPGGEIRNMYSGNVTENCPVGALTNTDWRYKIRVWRTFTVDTICRYCSDGCNLRVSVGRKKLQRALSRTNNKIDEGLPCDLGRYGYQFAHHDDRLTRPMIKKDNELVECSWDEALSVIKSKIDKTVKNLSPQSVAALVGETLSNEDYFAIGRFFRTVIGTNSIDHRMDRKRKLNMTDDVVRRELCINKLNIADLEKAKTFFVIGSDIQSENPITFLRMLKTKRYKGARIISLNPRPTPMNRAADEKYIYRAFSEVRLLQGLARIILEKKFYNTEIVKLNKDEIKRFLDETKDFNIKAVSEQTGIDAPALEALAQELCQSPDTVFVTGETTRRHYMRDQILVGLYNLAKLTGNLNTENSGILMLGGQSNTAGCYFMGMRPDQLPYNSGINQTDKISQIWNGKISDFVGADTVEILQKINDEKIECGFVIGSDPADVYPDREYINKALAKLDFLVVADMFLTDTAKLADVVLPISSHFESNGTFVNWEGTIQKFEKAIANIGESLPVWKIFSRLASLLGTDFEYKSSDDIFTQIAMLIGNESVNSLQSVPSDGWRFDRKREYPDVGLHALKLREPNVEDYPYTVIYGNGDHHFRRNFSNRCESLNRFLADPYIGLNPDTATDLTVSEGELVKLENSCGKIIGKVLIIPDLPGDVVFIPDNFPEVKANMIFNKDMDIDRANLVKM